MKNKEIPTSRDLDLTLLKTLKILLKDSLNSKKLNLEYIKLLHKEIQILKKELNEENN